MYTYLSARPCVRVRVCSAGRPRRFIQNWCFHARALRTEHAAHTGRGSTGRPHSRPHSRSAASECPPPPSVRSSTGRVPLRRRWSRHFSPPPPRRAICSYLVLPAPPLQPIKTDTLALARDIVPLTSVMMTTRRLANFNACPADHTGDISQRHLMALCTYRRRPITRPCRFGLD